uniref:Transmembrane protein 119a n=1 Tax=Esox lucius TaxID=8010 RepID=A0A3P8Z1M8_ESOLU
MTLCCFQLSWVLLYLIKSSPSQATPLWLNMSLEGSAEAEDQDSLIPNLSTTATVGPASESSTTLDGSTHVELSLLDQMVQFLQDNMLLIMVASILFITIFLILCCACIMSRKRKVNAYYPSSFPSKIKQLQEDIMRATKNLRTPSKPSLVRQQEKDITPIAVAKTPEVTVPAEGEYTENVNEPSNPPPEPSEDEGCQLYIHFWCHCGKLNVFTEVNLSNKPANYIAEYLSWQDGHLHKNMFCSVCKGCFVAN